MNRPVIALMGSSLLWGCAWMPLKALGQAGLDGLVLVLCTFSLLTLATLPMAWRRTGGASAAGPLLLIALLGGGANLAFTLAMVYGEVVRAMALFYLLPLWGVLGGRLILGEPIDGLRWLGVALALSGAWLILGGVDILHTLPSGFELFGLLAGFLLAMNNLVFRGVAQLPLSPKLAAMFAGCAALAGLGLIGTDQSWPTGISPLAWGGVLLYAFVWLLPANLGAQYGVTHLEAGRASVILILELVAAVVSATLIGDEWMTPLEWTGAGLILSAALIEALRSESRSPVARSDAH
ncbi:MAG: DMT family transporter [Candidatus Thiodiazotropha sp.]